MSCPPTLLPITDPVHPDVRSDSAAFHFTQRAQLLALVWRDPDPVQRLPRIWNVLRAVPIGRYEEDSVAIALIVWRIAYAFVTSQPAPDITLAARIQRRGACYIHCLRALDHMSREFTDPDYSLRTLAQQCGVSIPYVSHVVAVTTGYGCRTHLRSIRLLHAVFELVTTTKFVEEVAMATGYRSTAALDHDFRRGFHLRPSQLRLWAI
jgi:AraC-like DNA-binding protein